MAFTFQDMGARTLPDGESSIFSVMAGWIAEVLFWLFLAYICILLCNR